MIFLLAIGSPTLSPAFSSEPIQNQASVVSVLWTAQILNKQFLTSLDIPARRFELVEYLDCGVRETLDCSTLIAKQFTFKAGVIRLIEWTEVDGQIYGVELERTENKHIEIFNALRAQTPFVDNFEIGGLGEFEAEYWFDAEVPTQLHCQLDFKDLRGNLLWQENCGSSVIQSIEAFHDQARNSWLVFIDGRSCGASSCSGNLKILQVGAP